VKTVGYVLARTVTVAMRAARSGASIVEQDTPRWHYAGTIAPHMCTLRCLLVVFPRALQAYTSSPACARRHVTHGNDIILKGSSREVNCMSTQTLRHCWRNLLPLTGHCCDALHYGFK
jgi:hypothetical protein